MIDNLGELDTEKLQAIVQLEVERAQEEIVTSVSLRRDEPKFFTLRKKARALPEGSKERKRIERRMRTLAPPTSLQVRLRRVLGIGAVAAITGFTIKQGLDAHTAWTAANASFQHLGQNVWSALSHVHIDIFNLGKSFNEAGSAVNSVIAKTVDTAGAAVDHTVKTVEGAAVDGVALLLRPWRRPLRRGRVPL